MKQKTITAGELRKMHGKRVRVETGNGVVCGGKISVNKDGEIYVVHNNIEVDGFRAGDMLGYDYSWLLYESCRNDNHSDNWWHNWIEILDEEDTTNLPEILNINGVEYKRVK